MTNSPRKPKPEIKLGYLLAIVVTLFGTANWAVIGALLGVQTALWLGSAIGWRPLKRLLKRLIVLFAVIALSYGFVSVGEGDRWRDVTLGPVAFEVNLGGLKIAGLMCLRVLLLVMASAWVQQSGAPGDFAGALRRFHVPVFLAASIDGALRLAAGGGGNGGGKGKNPGAAAAPGLSYAQIRRGRLSVVKDLLDRNLARAEAFIGAGNPSLSRDQVRDVTVIVAVAVAIMSVKMLQIMPGLPIAPGHKNVLIIPFFLIAASLTKMRLGGFWAGLTTGVVSVLLGYGKYGVLEIAHFAAPGLLADMLMPVAGLKASRWLRLLNFAAIGAVMGAGRFAANFLVIILAGAPKLAFILYLPMLISQIAFGAVSAFVTLFLLDLMTRPKQ